MIVTLKPDYYDLFKCIAERCNHNCCIGWEIDIDPLTEMKYIKMEGKLGEKIRACTSRENGQYHFVLSDKERCPFLDNKGLCEIINEKGDSFLCNICRDHPRYRNIVGDCIEEGLGICCEEACRIILENKSKVEYVLNGNINLTQREQRAVNKRNRILKVLQDRCLTFDERAEKIYAICKINKIFDPYEWAEKLRKAERLDPIWDKSLDLLICDEKKVTVDQWEIQWEQLAVYFLFRHYINHLYEGKEKERIQFVINSVKIIRAIFFNGNEHTIEKLEDIARGYSAEIEYLEN